MEEFYKDTLRVIEFQEQIERSGAERLKGYKAELATFLKNLGNPTHTPVREKKKPKHLSHNESTSSTNSEANNPAQSSGRPIRSAAEKARLELKEPALGKKMRQDPVVKLERISKENNPNSINVKMEKLSIAAQKKKSNERSSDSKKEDESVIVVPNNTNAIVHLSDDEEGVNELLMPPPPKPAPRKINSKKIHSESNRSAAVKSEQIENLASQRPVRSTRGKRLVPQPFIVAKNEKLSNVTPAAGKGDLTLESVYEDAIADDGQSKGSSKPSEMEIDGAMSLPIEPADSTYIQSPKTNEATFVEKNQRKDRTTTIQSSMAGDTTFVLQDAACNIGEPNNETFCVQAAPPSEATKKMSISSIMTEDDSDDEIPLQVLSKKPNHELFNPCVQSPMKKKVEAFEKHAHDAQSPQQRQTRIKTRAKAAAVDESSSLSSTVSAAKAKFNTPNIADQRQNAKGSHVAPQSLNAATGSKIAHLNRGPSASRIQQHSRENSAEDAKRGLQVATEDKKRKRDEKLKQVQQQREAREKEKLDKVLKQMQEKEEKLRQENEKKRLAKEKKDREAETRKNLEEINRNLKAQQQKQTEESIRVHREQMDVIRNAMEKKKEREAETRKNLEEINRNLKLQKQKEEAMRVQREEMDAKRIVAEKALLQQKLKQNIAKKKPPTTKYTFDMLNTDDETDDESNPKPGRPTPPEWSLRGNREERIASQSYVSKACIDQMFPVVAMTPNLKELFPDINEKYLRRNSSAVWKTPPRYSTMQLPKYDV